MLTLASSGTFLHTGLKIPGTVLRKEGKQRGQEPPRTCSWPWPRGAACVLIGVFPTILLPMAPVFGELCPVHRSGTSWPSGAVGFTGRVRFVAEATGSRADSQPRYGLVLPPVTALSPGSSASGPSGELRGGDFRVVMKRLVRARPRCS